MKKLKIISNIRIYWFKLNFSHQRIQSLPKLLDSINSLVSKLKDYNFQDKSLRIKVNNQIQIINEKVKPKQLQLNELLNRVIEKERKLAKRLSIVVQEAFEKEQLSKHKNSNYSNKEINLGLNYKSNDNYNEDFTNKNNNDGSKYEDSSYDSSKNHSRALTLKS